VCKEMASGEKRVDARCKYVASGNLIASRSLRPGTPNSNTFV
jgi:hypothetical protein